MGSILGPKINQKSSRFLIAVLGRLLGGPGAPQLPKSMIFIETVANFQRSPFSPRDRFLIDFGAILEAFWAPFWRRFLLFCSGCVPKDALGAKKGND